MNKLISELKSQKGFTLVELLVVIVVIGILATALLAAINPLEQIRRAQDSGNIAAARELVEACERFVASSEGDYPGDLAEIVAADEIKSTYDQPTAVTFDFGDCTAEVDVESTKYTTVADPYPVP